MIGITTIARIANNLRPEQTIPAAGFWPKVPGSPYVRPPTKCVVTHKPDSLGWGPFEALGPRLVEDARRIKAQYGSDPISPARDLCPQASLSMPTGSPGL